MASTSAWPVRAVYDNVLFWELVLKALAEPLRR